MFSPPGYESQFFPPASELSTYSTLAKEKEAHTEELEPGPHVWHNVHSSKANFEGADLSNTKSGLQSVPIINDANFWTRLAPSASSAPSAPLRAAFSHLRIKT